MSTRVVDHYETLMNETAHQRHVLLSHPVYSAVRDQAALRLFMETHVFAVWDFMSLLKAMQRQLTCVQVPWTPPSSQTAARFVNEIVLGEETDEVVPGCTTSHYELYLKAMREVGADTAHMDALVAAVRSKMPVERALARLHIPPHARTFVEGTMTLATTGRIEEIAASFLLGREDLVPAMFKRLVPEIEQSTTTASLHQYLVRHIEVDEGSHGPLARQLLCDLCGTNPRRWKRATRAAQKALEARCALWDGVMRGLPWHEAVTVRTSPRLVHILVWPFVFLILVTLAVALFAR